MSLSEHLYYFIERAWPSAELWLFLFPAALLYGAAVGWLAGWLRVQKKWRVGYTRKLFHFLIFTAAGVLQLVWALPVVVVFGTAISLLVLWAVYKGESSPFYLALARPSDAPKEKLFILIPLLTTAAGGVLANLFFLEWAAIGYLVGGWGDAVGEPVGSRWGKHRYRVPSMAGVAATRSLEGSAAVFVVSAAVAFMGLQAQGLAIETALPYALLIALAATGIEAISTHGLDNLTIQLAAAGTAYWLIN
ncbi:dolichol kinase [Flammeovirgaceae bacterium 311]|nr:dolichol kinase [Flammeovirgaceae bacterium 311]